MSESNFHKGFINEEDTPIPIPPVREGWSDMQRRLRVAMPLTRKFSWTKYIKTAGVVAVVATTTVVLLVIRHARQRTHTTTQAVAADSTHASDMWNTISRQRTGTHPIITRTGTDTAMLMSGMTAPTAKPGVTTTANTSSPKTGVITGTDTRPPKPTDHLPLKKRVINSSVTVADIKLPGKKKEISAKIVPGKQQKSITSLNKSSKKLNKKDKKEDQHPGHSAATPIPLLQSLPLAAPDKSRLLKTYPEGVPSMMAGTHTHKDRTQYWQVMVQWTFPVPLSGSAYYFTGPDGNNQAYRLLFPDARIVKQWKNAAVSLDLTPFASQTYNDHIYEEKTFTDTLGHTRKQTKTLTKKFGWSTSLAYHHRIGGQWQAAAGIQLNYWQQAGIYQQEFRKPDSSFNNNTKEFVKERSSNLEWLATGEVYYNAARWQGGLRIAVPINMDRSDTILTKIKSPVQLQLVLRYKLLHRRNK